MEEWKTIPEVESVLGVTYEISSWGRVRSSKRRFMKRFVDGDGYFTVSLRKGDSNIAPRVNRLVAKAFIPNTEELPIVEHLDDDKQNDRADNLKWSIIARNTIKACARPVAQLDPITHSVLDIYESSSEAARKLKLSSANINVIAGNRGLSLKTGKIRCSGGFSWTYVDLLPDEGT